VPVPELRLGAGPMGYTAVKNTFEGIDWAHFHITPPASPLAAAAAAVYEEMVTTGVTPEFLNKFSEDYPADNWSSGIAM
jgi:hypothetical protein